MAMRTGAPGQSFRLTTAEWIGLLVAILIMFVLLQASYISFKPVPGNDPRWPLGWWGWFDQGNYLRAAKAFLDLNFAPSEHYYPPLYPLVGAAFVGLSPAHPFYFVDLAATFGFFLLFVFTTRRYVGFWAALVVGATFMVAFHMVRLQWVIPWTSTLSALLVAAGLYLFDRFDRARGDGRWGIAAATSNAFVFGLLCGLQLPLRPGDILLMAPIALGYGGLVVIDMVNGPAFVRRRAIWSAVAGVVGLIPGAVLMFGFNLIVFGDLLGGYFEGHVDKGFYFADLPEKVFSLVVASHPIYLERGADWLTELPLNALCIGFVPAAALFARPLVFRIAAVAALLQMALYFSFSDALPTGTFRYWNIHYFKWMLPWMAVFAVSFVYQSAAGIRDDRGRARTGLATGVLLTLLLFSVNVEPVPRSTVTVEEGDQARLVLHNPQGRPIEYIDIDGKPGDWGQVYFDNHATIRLDGGDPLQNYGEYRMLPRGGDGIRLVFIRPTSAFEISVDFGESLTPTADLDGTSVRPYDVNFGLDLPFASHWR
ncbi:hypothetical protein [Amorphus sp. 3PC139-8]|uniref:hypothetical protein n=1 Tax=Amorphus sp. 3PC139-8 TaxID=2735676 RepID=UPI00345DA29A